MISGKEAKIAWANGENLQVNMMDSWEDLTGNFRLSVFECDDYKFRIKPKTITINGVEVPPPSTSPEKYVYVLSAYTQDGYQSVKWYDGFSPFCYWNSEEEIKQVVEVLGNVFNS